MTALTVCACGATRSRIRFDTGELYLTRYRIRECSACGLLFPDPLPTPEESRQYYSSGYGRYGDSEQIAADYESGAIRAHRLLDKVRRWRGLPSGRFLDLGCGNGGVLHHMAKSSAYECIGVEVTEESVRAAREHAEAEVFHGTLQEACFPDNHFAVARMDQVIEHVRELAELLGEIERVLVPGGLLFVGTPNFGGFSARVLGPRWKEVLPYDHVWMFTPKSLRLNLERSGLQVVSVVTAGVALVRRPDLVDLAGWARKGPTGRAVSLGLRLFGLGDLINAVARK